jgi:hypothetical protein
MLDVDAWLAAPLRDPSGRLVELVARNRVGDLIVDAEVPVGGQRPSIAIATYTVTPQEPIVVARDDDTFHASWPSEGRIELCWRSRTATLWLRRAGDPSPEGLLIARQVDLSNPRARDQFVAECGEGHGNWRPERWVEPAVHLLLAALLDAAGISTPDARDEGVKRAGTEVTPHLRPAAAIEAPADLHDWLIEGLVRRRQLVILASVEGLGKSQARRELGIRAATGTGALFGHYPIPHPLRVAVFDEDNGEREEFLGEATVLAALGLERTALTELYRASFLGVHLVSPEGRRKLEQEIDAIRPGLVILDTGGLMVGDEWGRELKEALRFLRGLAEGMDTAILVTVHLVKPPRDGTPSDSGRRGIADVMGQWTRNADVVTVMTDLGDGRCRWESFKRCPKTVLILAQRDGLWDTVAVGETDRGPDLDDRVLACIGAGATRVKEVVTATGIPERTVWRVVRGLRRRRMLAPSGALSRLDADDGAEP